MTVHVKKIITFAMTSLLFSMNMFAQETFYVYRCDGIINQFLINEVSSIELSKIGLDGMEYINYVVQEIHTKDSISRIPLELIDSINFYPPEPTKSIFDAFVNIDWSYTKLVSCNPETGKYILSYNDKDPMIKEESVIIVEKDSISYIVLVTEVKKDGNTYEIKGDLGDLSYIFYDTEFTLSTDDKNDDTLLANHLYKPILAPIRKEVDVGKNHIRVTGSLWKDTSKEQTHNLYKKGNVHAYTKSKFGLNLDYEVTIRFGDKEREERQGKMFFRAKNYYVDGNIKGDMNAYYGFFIDVVKEEQQFDIAPNEKDKYVLLKHKLFPNIPIKFSIGTVPVLIVLGTDLFADVNLKGGGEFHFSTGIGADASTLIGAKYNPKDHNGVEIYYQKPTLSITPYSPTVSGKGMISGKLHIFPRVHAWLYGWAGPSFDIKPFLLADLSGGFKKDLLQNDSSDYCAWSLKTYCGLDLAAGLSSSNMNYEVWNKSTKDITVYKYNLYESPVDIKFIEAITTDTKEDNKTEVKFEVYDKGFNGNILLTPLPQIVKYEGNGEIKSTEGPFGIVKSGVTTAEWAISSSKNMLYAKLYDINGDVIAADSVQIMMKPYTDKAEDIEEDNAIILGHLEGDINFLNSAYSYGFIYSKNNNPKEDGIKVYSSLTGNASLHSKIDELEDGTTYYYCAFLCIDGEYTYGEIKSFKTLEAAVEVENLIMESASYYPNRYTYNGKKYSFKYNCITTVELKRNKNVEDWGYIYEDPDGSKARISCKNQTNIFHDDRYAFCRNENNSKVKLYGYVKYFNKEDTCYGKVKEFPISYPIGSSITMTNCGFKGTEPDVDYQGKTYKYKSTFRFLFTASGAYWLKVKTKEEGEGWNGWNNLPDRVMSPVDGANALTVNYYYNEQNFDGDFHVYLYGNDETHTLTYKTDGHATLFYSNGQFSGCSYHPIIDNAKGFGISRTEKDDFYEVVIDKCF